MKEYDYFACDNLSFTNYADMTYEDAVYKYFDNKTDGIKVDDEVVLQIIELNKDEYNLKGIMIDTQYNTKHKEDVFIQYEMIDVYLYPIIDSIPMTLNREIVEYIINSHVNPFVDYIVNKVGCRLINKIDKDMVTILAFDFQRRVNRRNGKGDINGINIEGLGEYEEYAHDSYIFKDIEYDICERKLKDN